MLLAKRPQEDPAQFVSPTSTPAIGGRTRWATQPIIKYYVPRTMPAVGGDSTSPSISFNGLFVAFASDATNLGGDETLGHRDIFVREIQAGLTARVSVSTEGDEANGPSSNPAISSSSDPDVVADGRFIAFQSDATNLVVDDTNIYSDIFVRDRTLEVTSRVSVPNDPLDLEPNGDSFTPSIAATALGQLIAFASDATNLVDGDDEGFTDIFLRDLVVVPPVTLRISEPPGLEEVNGDSFAPVISADGRFVVFHSDADNLLGPGLDNNLETDVFVYDVTTKVISRASVNSAGAEAIGGGSSDATISAQGRFVGFESDATNLVPSDVGGFTDIFFRDQSCLGDFNGDFVVDATDLAMLLAAWGPYDCPPYWVYDFDQDCEVGAEDLANLLANWGPCG